MGQIKQLLAGISPLSGERTKNNKKLLALFTTILLISAIIGIIAGVNSGQNSTTPLKSTTTSKLATTTINIPIHPVLQSACSNTLYPELCYSAVAAVPGATDNLATHQDVIETSINITMTAVEHNYFTVDKLIANRAKFLTRREKTALHDCLETIDETLDELHKALEDVTEYPSEKKSLSQHADDLKTLMSAAITNQETCLDGFSHDNADRHVREALRAGLVHVEHMCSNALAMIKNMTDMDILEAERLTKVNKNRKLKESIDDGDNPSGGWPKWLSAGDRHLLQTTTVTPDVVVAADGSGNYKTVAEAVAAAPDKSSKRFIIKIKAGVYRENVEVTKKKTNLMFIGDGRKNTIITGSRSVRGGSTTFKSATVAAVGEKFLAKDLTFENTAGSANHQAVALRVGSDLSAFYQCDIIGHQDSLYVHSNRQFFINCFISGTVDFIFGNAAVVLQDCDIHARLPGPGQKNMVTAQGRTDPNQNTGIVIQKCRIGATKDLEAAKSRFPTFLGRPWKEYSRTIIMQSSITDVIDPVGWHEWSGTFALSTLDYAEYLNTGAGAGTSKRVNWKGYRVLKSDAEAEPFTPRNFIAGSSWLGGTGFPFALGL